MERKAQEKNWTKERLVFAIKRSQNPVLDKGSLKLPRPKDISYLYKARVIDVIDGDTLLLNINLGFLVNKEQRVRLLGLDTPELKTKAGQKSYKFLLNKMAGLDNVLIQTKKVDIYGRYLAHVFYDPNQTSKKMDNNDVFVNGVHLNEEILREGFAEVM